MAQTAGCTGGGKISKQIAKQMAAAQDAMKAKRWQEVALEDARGRRRCLVPSRRSIPYTMSEFRGYVYSSTRQEADAARELEDALNSPCMPEAKKADALEEPGRPVHGAEELPKGHRLR